MPEVHPEYDFIIAGAGCAGLSLAYRLSFSPVFSGKKLLLIDRDKKELNDRTWCFWEKQTGPFESIVHRKWEFLDFYSTAYHKPLHISPYHYKMIRGIDFYNLTKSRLEKLPQVTWMTGEINNITGGPEGASVTVDGLDIRGKWVFNSLFQPGSNQKNYHYLLQHFKGWVIESPKPVFDPDKAILMDFRVPQQGDTRFCYVLPLDEKRALIEYTLFSPTLLPEKEYDEVLEDYIKKFLNITDYQVLEREFGVIPMTNMPFPVDTGNHIIHIGTSGGNTKASTGYTFVRIQRQVSQIIRQLEQTGKPSPIPPPSSFRYRWIDRIFLNVLARQRYPADHIFTIFFKKNEPAAVLDFLDEQTSIRQDLQVITTLPVLPFLKAFLEELTIHK